MMASVYTATVVKDVRIRKGLTRNDMLDRMPNSETSLSRLESGAMVPTLSIFDDLKNALDFHIDAMICPHLDNQPMEVYAFRHLLITALDRNDIEDAESLIEEIESISTFDTPVNRQFLLSQKSRLLEKKGQAFDVVMPLVYEVLQQTFEHLNENSPKDTVLIFEEPELFHTMARAYARMGKLSNAIRILDEVQKELLRLPIADRHKDKQIVQVLLSLAEYYLQSKNYSKVIDTCDLGCEISATRNQGLHMPDFKFKKALAIAAIDPNKTSAYRPLIQQAYFGYILLNQIDAAETVKVTAKTQLNITFKTYGVESLAHKPRRKVPYARGEVIACNHVGEMIKPLREKMGLSLNALSWGICDKATLQRIESDKIASAHVHLVEPIMQRLGRYVHYYCNFFLTKEDYEGIKERDEIHRLLVTRKYEIAEEKLNKLRKSRKYKAKTNLQFIKRADIGIFQRKNPKHPDTPSMIVDALSITCPKFNEKDIETYPLTHDESILINMLAIYYKQTGDLERAANIYKKLLDNLNRRYEDEQEKARMYASVAINYSSCLGQMGKIRDALYVAEDAIEFECDRDRLTRLASLYYNKAHCHLRMDEKEKSVPYFAVSYYGSMMFENYGQAKNAGITSKNVKEHLGIIFD
ncbi:MAG: helix-turn-helix transcriptional regulator [Defluviitaleaceae bacterium]|nr:helix-turn-helix transcriptional regulator [Defluviitaleaceae bacterium]